MIDNELIILEEECNDKEEIIRKVSNVAKKIGFLHDVENYIEKVNEREREFSTAIGNEIAIPHGKSSSVISPFVGIIRLKNEIKWDANNNEVKLIILLGVPEEKKSVLHLKILSEISKKLLDEDFREVLNKGTKKDISKIFLDVENKIIN